MAYAMMRNLKAVVYETLGEPLSDMIDKSTDNFVGQHYFYNLGRIKSDQNKQRLIGRN